MVTKQIENSNSVRSYIYCASTSRANFFFQGIRIQYMQIDHGNMIRDSTVSIKLMSLNWNYIAKAQEPSSLTEPGNKLNKNPSEEKKRKKSRTQIS